jgi:hypothetical protein
VAVAIRQAAMRRSSVDLIINVLSHPQLLHVSGAPETLLQLTPAA